MSSLYLTKPVIARTVLHYLRGVERRYERQHKQRMLKLSLSDGAPAHPLLYAHRPPHIRQCLCLQAGIVSLATSSGAYPHSPTPCLLVRRCA